MTALARTLWNRDVDYDGVAADYFTAAYGPDGGLCREYLTSSSEKRFALEVER